MSVSGFLLAAGEPDAPDPVLELLDPQAEMNTSKQPTAAAARSALLCFIANSLGHLGNPATPGGKWLDAEALRSVELRTTSRGVSSTVSGVLSRAPGGDWSF